MENAVGNYGDDERPDSTHSLTKSFQDESTECAICLGSLSDHEMEVIELTNCGHRWHLECLKEQLAQAQPNPAQRLVLTGCRCAKCGSVCDHPSLQHLTRKTDDLQQKIDTVLKEQLGDDQKNDAEALERARRKYAIYLCSHCQEPYFGGTIACADTIDGEVPPNERLCVACAPTRLQQIQCRNPLEHRGHHIWKCRYCCQVATHVCYGTVHFCHGCHDRNSERVALVRRHQQQQRQKHRIALGRGDTNSAGLSSSSNDGEPPSCLSSIPCPGGDACPFPKPPGENRHMNGSSADCEQVYGCVWCESNPTATDHAFHEPPGSINLLQNGSGQEGPPRHPVWQNMNRQSQWKVEQSDTPLSDTITTNFVSNFYWCIMAQAVSLDQFVVPGAASRIRVEASAKYMGRTDCPSLFRMEALFLNAQRQVIARQDTGQLVAPADFWERASLILEPAQGAALTVLVIHGKDRNFWAGNFGSKVTDCQIRILGTQEELEHILLPRQAADLVGAGNMVGARRATVHQNDQQNQWWWTLAAETILPAVCFIILAWLIQQ